MISVLLPVRSDSPGLIASVESIKSQTYSDWHIVALLDRDNGTNRQKLRSLLREDQFTIVPCNYEETGFPAMLNLGIKFCSGSLIARQDDDDISLPNRFELQVQYLENEQDAVLVCGFANVIDTSGNFLHEINQPLDSYELAHQLVRKNIIPHSSAMFRKSSLLQLGGYRVKMHGCEDYDLWLRFLTIGKIGSVGQVVLLYLSNPLGMTLKPIHKATIQELRRSRMTAQEVLKICKLRANLNDFCWLVRQRLIQSQIFKFLFLQTKRNKI
jgi:glycosyltransferase EpsE